MTYKNGPAKRSLITYQWLVLLLACLLVPSCDFVSLHDPVAPEIKAIRALGLLREAEAKFNAESGRYADLKELGRQGRIPSDLAAGSMEGYEFSISVFSDRYIVTAIPKERRVGAERSFYLDQSGVIRQNWNGPADAKSEQVK